MVCLYKGHWHFHTTAIYSPSVDGLGVSSSLEPQNLSLSHLCRASFKDMKATVPQGSHEAAALQAEVHAAPTLQVLPWCSGCTAGV